MHPQKLLIKQHKACLVRRNKRVKGTAKGQEVAMQRVTTRRYLARVLTILTSSSQGALLRHPAIRMNLG